MRKLVLFIKAALISLCVLIAPQAHAQSIPFYLPLSKAQLPEISAQLEAALFDAGLAQFKVRTTDYWHPYQQGLRRGREGVYFAAPHFAAWSITKNNFVPILRLKSELQYVMIARRADSEIFEVNDLAGKTVCTERAPNLDFLLSRTALKKALILARTKHVKSVPQAMRDDDKDCQAFSVSRHIFEGFAKTEPFRFIRLQQSEATKNYGFVLDRETAFAHGVALKKFLSSTRAKTILQPMYKLYSNSPAPVSVKTADYEKQDFAPLLDYWQ